MPPDSQSNSGVAASAALAVYGVKLGEDAEKELAQNTGASEDRKSGIIAVFETLTQQYKIAKVQEARETPSVKLPDDASLPEHRSFPPRTLIAFACGFMAFMGVAVWIVAEQRWERADDGDRRKQFAVQVFHDMSSIMPWTPSNGSRWQATSNRAWIRLRSRERQAIAEEQRGENQVGENQ